MQSLYRLRTTVHLKDDVFLPGAVTVGAGLLLLCWFHHKTYGSTFLCLSPSFLFLWCLSHQDLIKPRMLLTVGLLELFFASVMAEIFNYCVIVDAGWNNSSDHENNMHFCCWFCWKEISGKLCNTFLLYSTSKTLSALYHLCFFRDAEMVVEISKVVSVLWQAWTCLEKLCISARQQMRLCARDLPSCRYWTGGVMSSSCLY